MVAQSRSKIVLLTRPLTQSEDFAQVLQQRVAAPLSILISPLMRAEFLNPPIPARQFAAVIFTSQTAVAAARRIIANGITLPDRAFCVGQETARLARLAGFEALSANGDSGAILAMIATQKLSGPLLHLRGVISTGSIKDALVSAGIETVEAVVYQQITQSLSDAARTILSKPEPVFIPLFSPRSASIFSAEIQNCTVIAPLYIAAMSPSVAQKARTLPAATIQTALSPDASGIINTLLALFALDCTP